MKTYQLITHPKSLNRGLEVEDDARSGAPLMVDMVPALLSPEELDARKRQIASRILESFHGRAFVDDLLHHELFRRFWDGGEKLTDRQVIAALGIPARV